MSLLKIITLSLDIVVIFFVLFNEFIFNFLLAPNHLLSRKMFRALLVPLEKDKFHLLARFAKVCKHNDSSAAAWPRPMMNTRFLIFNGFAEVTSSRLYTSQRELLLTSKGAIVRAHSETHSCSRGRKSSPPTDMSSFIIRNRSFPSILGSRPTA